MKQLIIPNALQIDMDDMGWFCGTDDRKQGGPSRTGVTRRHVPADYEAVNELGRRLNMKINCAFVVGEWDPDNRLRTIPHLSKYGDGWNNAAYYDARIAAECAAILNRSDYVNLCVHGLLHGYYMDGVDSHDISDYYYRIKGQVLMVPQEEIRHRLDAFFDLLKYHGIDKKIDTMIPPSFYYRWNELSEILREYGIRYVGTIYRSMKSDGSDALPEVVGIERSGMITYDRHHNPIAWDKFGGPYEDLPILDGLVGVHWPNFLHEDPARNMETVERAAAYFRRCGREFGTVLSRDVAFYVTQSLYKRYAKTAEEDGVFTVDLSAVPKVPEMNDRFYLSSKKPILSWEGCTLSEYGRFDGHVTYEVLPLVSQITLKTV